MKILLPERARGCLEGKLPDDVEPVWFDSHDEANQRIDDVTVAWVDQSPSGGIPDTLRHAGPDLRWVNTLVAGMDFFPLDLLKERGIVLTNGKGINAVAVAEYAVMGVLAAAKRFDEVVRAGDRRDWLKDSPGKRELTDTAALIVGMGAIGREIGRRLAAFGVAVTGATRSGSHGTLKADEWQGRLGEFDWVVIAAPSTGSTQAMIGAGELAAMKGDAWLVNIARADMVDQDALVAALANRRIGGAVLDVTDPEPLPADHPLWSAPNAVLTMHSAGRSQSKMFERAAALFLDNLAAWRDGRAMRNVVDLDQGY